MIVMTLGHPGGGRTIMPLGGALLCPLQSTWPHLLLSLAFPVAAFIRSTGRGGPDTAVAIAHHDVAGTLRTMLTSPQNQDTPIIYSILRPLSAGLKIDGTQSRHSAITTFPTANHVLRRRSHRPRTFKMATPYTHAHVRRDV